MQAYNKWAKCQLNEKKKKNVSEALVIYILFVNLFVYLLCVLWILGRPHKGKNTECVLKQSTENIWM